MPLPLRSRRITAALNLEGTGIEYGPLHRTIVPKSDCRVRYVDYADRKALVEHYKNDRNVDVNLIPEIDIVTDGRLISNFIEPDTLDFVVASHVLEHVPDFIGWLESNLAALKPGGRIAIAFPDKRYCFDMKRRSSTLSDIVAAHIEKRTRPTFSQICDHFFNVVKTTPREAWEGRITFQNAEYIYPRQQVMNMLKATHGKDKYTDCHCWILADNECMERLEQVKEFSSLKYEIISFYPTARNTTEFYFTLEKQV